MRKTRFIVKILSDNRCKVYINKKWLKDVVELSFHGTPQALTVNITQNVRRNKMLVVEDNEIKTKTTQHTFKGVCAK